MNTLNDKSDNLWEKNHLSFTGFLSVETLEAVLKAQKGPENDRRPQDGGAR